MLGLSEGRPAGSMQPPDLPPSLRLQQHAGSPCPFSLPQFALPAPTPRGRAVHPTVLGEPAAGALAWHTAAEKPPARALCGRWVGACTAQDPGGSGVTGVAPQLHGGWQALLYMEERTDRKHRGNVS